MFNQCRAETRKKKLTKFPKKKSSLYGEVPKKKTFLFPNKKINMITLTLLKLKSKSMSDFMKIGDWPATFAGHKLHTNKNFSFIDI